MQPVNGYRDDRFNPPANVPQEIALKWADGRPCQSKYSGDQVRFVLTDDRQWYVDVPLAEKMRALHLASGELFIVTKKEVLRGNRRSAEWELKRAGADAAAPAVAPAPLNPSQSTQTRAQPDPTPAPAAAPRPAAPVINGPTKAVLVETGHMAIEAVLEVEQFAHAHGMPDFAFGAENIQKVWMSLYIEVNRKWGR